MTFSTLELPLLQRRRYMGTVLAIDPGCTESAWCIYDGEKQIPKDHDKQENAAILERIRYGVGFDAVVIEWIASYGMSVGREVFDTCLWAGRFYQTATDRGMEPTLCFRRTVKSHLCGTTTAKDKDVRAAIIDRYGPDAIGRKATPGPLYGVTADVWAALGVAITFVETTSEVAK